MYAASPNLEGPRKLILLEVATTGRNASPALLQVEVSKVDAIGASDAIGAVPADRPTNPGEIIATVFKSLGLDLHAELPGPAGRPFPLVDFGVREIQELFS